MTLIILESQTQPLFLLNVSGVGCTLSGRITPAWKVRMLRSNNYEYIQLLITQNN